MATFGEGCGATGKYFIPNEYRGIRTTSISTLTSRTVNQGIRMLRGEVNSSVAWEFGVKLTIQSYKTRTKSPAGG